MICMTQMNDTMHGMYYMMSMYDADVLNVSDSRAIIRYLM